MDRKTTPDHGMGQEQATLNGIQAALQSIHEDYKSLAASVDTIQKRLNQLNLVASEGEGNDQSRTFARSHSKTLSQLNSNEFMPFGRPDRSVFSGITPAQSPELGASDRLAEITPEGAESPRARALSAPKIILTTYPGQFGTDPVPLPWGHADPLKRGPVVVSRAPSTIRRRNAIGAHGGSYSIYHALAVASKNVDVDYKPDFTNSEPAVSIGPFPQWSDPKKIVSMDPLGHLSPWLYSNYIRDEGIQIRPTIAVTKAHMRLPELEQSVKAGRLTPDGKICLNDSGELAVTKFAVEPVWYLPGVAERFGISEGSLRRSLFEHTGGSLPELITRGDIKVFLPPIGGLTVYCFGNPANMSDPNCRLALRIHDECNGSDVFGSDICTCRPYLIFGVEEAVKEAQNGGSGVVVYFRKEGRALGEVTKYLVYNAREQSPPQRYVRHAFTKSTMPNKGKRGTDRASDYFKRTENIAGVKDMRFQSLMPDILHWLGITKIDRMLSMSNMKYDAIVEQGIPIHERVPIPEEMIPEDSRVEIDAKIHAGYFTNGKILDEAQLDQVHGRAWDDVDH